MDVVCTASMESQGRPSQDGERGVMMTTTHFNLQEQAIVREYEKALRFKAFLLAKRMGKANPDLENILNKVYNEVFHLSLSAMDGGGAE